MFHIFWKQFDLCLGHCGDIDGELGKNKSISCLRQKEGWRSVSCSVNMWGVAQRYRLTHHDRIRLGFEPRLLINMLLVFLKSRRMDLLPDMSRHLCFGKKTQKNNQSICDPKKYVYLCLWPGTPNNQQQRLRSVLRAEQSKGSS